MKSVVKLGPFAKALVPAVLAALLVVGNLLLTGGVDEQELAVAISGVVSAAVTFLVPNSEAPAPK